MSVNNQDPFAVNILGVDNLISSGINKTNEGSDQEEGVEGEEIDILELKLDDDELRTLSEQWDSLHNGYYPKVKPRQEKNKLYYVGLQKNTTGTTNVIASNLIFESEETFIPQALSKNPEPVVWSDNTDEGKEASSEIKTMLQYHADTLCLRKKLGVMVRHWGIYFVGVIKHGWDAKTNDITLDIRKPQNFKFDPDGYVNEYGDFVGEFLGEMIECTAEKLIEKFPKSKDYILIKCDGKLGTKIIYTEWHTNEYTFCKFQDEILDKHKNEYFNYEKGESATPTMNHFSAPKMPYTFLSVFSLQERPHDVTSLIEQSIANQDSITERDEQITRNLKSSNNSLVLSQLHGWNSENAREAAQSVEDGDPILAPADIAAGIQRLPASPLPAGILQAQQTNKDTLRSVFGTQGLTAQPQNEETTARGMILNQSHDSSRIGGGIGDALEQVADNIFNWWLQLYYVFYDEPHYGAVMGSGRAVEYVKLINSNINRHFVVSVSPNSMTPKDEITERNEAIELWNAKAIDPITLFKKLNFPDPMETAKQVVMWSTNPQQYMATFFPEAQPQPNSANPQMGQLQPGQGSPPPELGQEPANASLSQVKLPA